MVETDHPDLSIRRQCELLALPRSSWYYQPAEESALNLQLMRLIDEQYTRYPFYGSRRMTAYLQRIGHPVNRKRVQRLMRKMGIQAIYPKPKAKKDGQGHKIYPYLLRGVQITHPHQVWSIDITYIPMRSGFMYLVAIIDWFSRYVLSWQLSNTLDEHFCLQALEQALEKGKPEIFNSDQGSQFTSIAFTARLQEAQIKISMDGRGRALDNVFIERLWRTVKYEHIYLNEYSSVVNLSQGLSRYFTFYNEERLHQSLGYLTPVEVHFNLVNPI